MPIYEYENPDPSTACGKCATRFELLQSSGEPPVSSCPCCGAPVNMVLSRCHAAFAARNESHARVGSAVKEYEKRGMWSHAAELAEKQSARTKDQALRTRALENYKKAGYDPAALEKHAKATGGNK